MSIDANPADALLPELTGDARADRWREHRMAVRSDLVDSTIRAVEQYGPGLSIDDVVKTAEIPRPKLYRFFADKEALFAAVRERAQKMVIDRVVPQFDLSGTVLELVRSALTAYVDLVDERPNLFLFLIGSNLQDSSPAELIEQGRPLSDATVAVIKSIIDAWNGDSDGLEYLVDALLGAVTFGVLRWLRQPTSPKDGLVEQLTTFVWGGLSAAVAQRGVALGPDTKCTLLDGPDND